MTKSNLVKHAEREMKLVGLDKSESDYNGMLYKATLDLIKTFSKQGHSGMSASMVIDLFTKLSSYKTLSDITSKKSDWMDVSEMSGQPMWQSNRNPSIFSKDGGSTWYDLNKK